MLEKTHGHVFNVFHRANDAAAALGTSQE